VSRGLADWDDETVALIREHFVAVAVPTWTAHAEGPEGDFLRRAGIDKHWVTSSGYMHCISASGRLLGGRASEEVLEAFAGLPASEREAGAMQVPELDPGDHLILAPPEGGLVLRVHARFLARDSDGGLRPAEPADFPLMRDNPEVQELWRLFLEPNTEYLWLTREEWQTLVPNDPSTGQRIAVDPSVTARMARFHLTPQRATTSEGGVVRLDQVREARAELVIEAVSPSSLEMRLEGLVHWGSDYEEELATSPDGPLAMGYATPLHGRVRFDRSRKAFTRFDLVAPGEVWGRWGDANGKSMPVERPGRAPFGFAFELASGGSPTDRIPPGGNSRYVTDGTGYFPDRE
jgi:hypothetical protein